jgi:hypothetical protein
MFSFAQQICIKHLGAVVEELIIDVLSVRLSWSKPDFFSFTSCVILKKSFDFCFCPHIANEAIYLLECFKYSNEWVDIFESLGSLGHDNAVKNYSCYCYLIIAWIFVEERWVKLSDWQPLRSSQYSSLTYRLGN